MVGSSKPLSTGLGFSDTTTSAPKGLRIAAIEHDRRFLQQLATRLDARGGALIVHGGPVTAKQLATGDPHAVLLDIALIGRQWEQWLSWHPARVPGLGILVCTGHSTLRQRVHGLQAGADGWVTKPCHPEEVLAHLEAIVRARRYRPPSEQLVPLLRGELEIRPDGGDVLAVGGPVGLGGREFAVLLQLALHEGQVLERERLHREVWGFTMAQGSRALDVVVRRLREKLALASPDWIYVHTHRGVGYRFQAEHVRPGRPTSIG
jgi:DNA-binding response OmpR family regulator